jgi:uncharacterized protein (DUF1800 family)
MVDQDRVIALNRFGLGARPGDLSRIGDARGWLVGQLRPQPPPTLFSGFPDSLSLLQHERQVLQILETPDTRTMRLDLGHRLYSDVANELVARTQFALRTENSFSERLVRFWSNHFAVSVDKQLASLYAVPMEREAIRRHLLGNFSEMLLAVETHPAMLRYLDNVYSIGADSPYVRRWFGGSPNHPGMNENLAREIFELHTLGVHGGYSQNDVIELAQAITGWGVIRPSDPGHARDSFCFHPGGHEPGVRTVLGKRYAVSGVEQGRSILRDLARHPATAHHLAFKLARHFVSDNPPATLVDRLSRSFLDTGGYLPELYRTLIGSSEAWAATAEKFKTPEEWLLSSCRACAIDADTPEQLRVIKQLSTQLGQLPLDPQSPAGYADTQADWVAPDAVYKRIQASQMLAELVPSDRSGLSIARSVVGDTLDAETSRALSHAESARQALTLWLASPSFQWR